MPATVTFLGHASVLVEIAGLRVLTDPVLFGHVTFLGRVSEPLDAAGFSDVDIVLISHLHHDHCDLRSLRTLSHARVVVPSGAGEYLYRKGVRNLIELPIGRHQDFGSVRITAVPAVHDGQRPPFGPRAEAVGYMISDRPQPVSVGSVGAGEGLPSDSGSVVYFAGDTDVFAGMADFTAEFGTIDVALLPVWGWGPNLGPGHMDPARAVDALELINPRFAMPIHWGTLFPFGLRKLRPSLGALLRTPPQDFAAIAANRELSTHLEIVQPGHVAEFIS